MHTCTHVCSQHMIHHVHRLLRDFGPFAEATIRAYTQQLLLGVAYLHAQHIAHRDLKCANVLLGDDGMVKIADFGTAKRAQSGSSDRSGKCSTSESARGCERDGSCAASTLDTRQLGILETARYNGRSVDRTLWLTSSSVLLCMRMCVVSCVVLCCSHSHSNHPLPSLALPLSNSRTFTCALANAWTTADRFATDWARHTGWRRSSCAPRKEQTAGAKRTSGASGALWSRWRQASRRGCVSDQTDMAAMRLNYGCVVGCTLSLSRRVLLVRLLTWFRCSLHRVSRLVRCVRCASPVSLTRLQENHSNPLTAMFHIASDDALPVLPSSLSDLAKQFLALCFVKNPSARPSAAELLQHPFVATASPLDDGDTSRVSATSALGTTCAGIPTATATSTTASTASSSRRKSSRHDESQTTLSVATGASGTLSDHVSAGETLHNSLESALSVASPKCSESAPATADVVIDGGKTRETGDGSGDILHSHIHDDKSDNESESSSCASFSSSSHSDDASLGAFSDDDGDDDDVKGTYVNDHGQQSHEDNDQGDCDDREDDDDNDDDDDDDEVSAAYSSSDDEADGATQVDSVQKSERIVASPAEATTAVLTDQPQDQQDLQDHQPQQQHQQQQEQRTLVLGIVRVIADYSTTDPSELSVVEGEHLDVLEMRVSGWWRGRRRLPHSGVTTASEASEAPGTRAVGWFPSTYVEWTQASTDTTTFTVKQPHTAQAHNELSLEAGDAVRIVRSEWRHDSLWANGSSDSGAVGWFPFGSILHD